MNWSNTLFYIPNYMNKKYKCKYSNCIRDAIKVGIRMILKNSVWCFSTKFNLSLKTL